MGRRCLGSENSAVFHGCNRNNYHLVLMRPHISKLADSSGTSWRKYAGRSLAAALVLIAATSCTPTSSAKTDLLEADAVKEVLDCRQSAHLYDDIAFYDAMDGISCFLGGDDAVHVRIYKNEGSVPVVLQDWTELMTSERQVLYTNKWFAVGAPNQLEKLKSKFNSSIGPTQTIPQGFPLTKDQISLGDCSLFLTQSISDFVLNPEQYRSTITVLDKKYPGAEKMIQDTMSSDVIREVEIRQRGLNMELDSYLSTFSSKIKPFCTSQLAE